MKKPRYFEIMKGHAVFRPTGEVSLEQGVQLVTSALIYAREKHFKRLLVDVTGLSGFEPPSISNRYFFVQEWARVAQGQVCVAMVARPEMIDQQKFGVTVANNAGLRCDVFESEEEALAWLKGVKRVPQAKQIQFTRG